MLPNPFDFTGRVAIVTGGGSGIGAVVAMMLAQGGADLVLAGRTLETLEHQAEKIRTQTGRRCIAAPADVREPEQAKALVARAIAEFGRIDILINNAGKGVRAPLRDIPPETWSNDIATNLHTAFHCAQAALPHLIESGHGVVINISSLAGVIGTRDMAAYSSAKAGVQMFTRVAAAEWGPLGVRVNCVAPGMIATERAQTRWASTGFDVAGVAGTFPLRRPGTPEEVARAVLFLASDAASYITGETLPVRGGSQI